MTGIVGSNYNGYREFVLTLCRAMNEKPDLAGCRCQPVQQRAVDVLWDPQWALTECVQWGERRQWSHLRFSEAV